MRKFVQNSMLTASLVTGMVGHWLTLTANALAEYSKYI